MTAVGKLRTHLVERAMESLGGLAGTSLPPLRPVRDATAEATPAPRLDQAAVPAPRKPIALAGMAAAGLVVFPHGAPRSRLSEEIAVIQHQVVRTLDAAPLEKGRCSRVVVVTSARPREGKSFISLNLAASIAVGTARRVTLVDADGKHGAISEVLECATDPGLRDFSRGTPPHLNALLRATSIERLNVLPCGGTHAGGAAAHSGENLASAVMRVAEALPDHVLIVDSPPCLSTSDATALAAIAGQVLMIVEAEQTQRNEVEAALDMVDACPTIQLVLNRATLTANDTFGAYSYEARGAYGAQPAS